jgi:hypothetical protein
MNRFQLPYLFAISSLSAVTCAISQIVFSYEVCFTIGIAVLELSACFFISISLLFFTLPLSLP